MAHFAEIDENNIVIQTVVVANDIIADGRFASGESEQKGIDFLKDLFPDSKTWVQTSYNQNFRGQFGGVGSKYDATLDKFQPPKQFASWVWNDSTNLWESPVAYEKGKMWDEETTSWVLPPKSEEMASWVWDETEGTWVPPDDIGFPTLEEGQVADWDDENKKWDIRTVS
tara:strand:- start:1824 stop:2333 length:510 start_codon:yes stop_codon:yes gene_type:complete